MRFAGNFHPEWGYLAPAPLPADSPPVATPAVPANVTASAESPPAIAALPVTSEPAATDHAADAAPVAPEPAATPKPALKKPHAIEHDAYRPPLSVAAASRKRSGETGLAPILRRLFSAHAGSTRAN